MIVPAADNDHARQRKTIAQDADDLRQPRVRLARVFRAQQITRRQHGIRAKFRWRRQAAKIVAEFCRTFGRAVTTEKDQTTKMTWADAMRRGHKFEMLNCPCGGKRRVIAAVQHELEIERFLRHLHLWPDEGEILSVRGPPELWDFEPAERAEAWDEVYEMEAQIAYDEEWAA